MPERTKRLYRAEQDARLAGVCGGVGEYLGIDPVVIRLLWVVVTCFTGFVPGTVAYLIAWVVVPVEPAPAVVAQPIETPSDSPA